ncbi:hypothetical protein ONZ45_g16793 [Pleurotus djamor]|nr:hypothetical protein ONZ45_g16793 [Pleurotus djamor]
MNAAARSQIRTLDEPLRSLALEAASGTGFGVEALQDYLATHRVGWPNAMNVAPVTLSVLAFKAPEHPASEGDDDAIEADRISLLALSSLAYLASSVQQSDASEMSVFFTKHQKRIFPWLSYLQQWFYFQFAGLHPEMSDSFLQTTPKPMIIQSLYGIIHLLACASVEVDLSAENYITDTVTQLWRQFLVITFDEDNLQELALIQETNHLVLDFLRRSSEGKRYTIVDKLGGASSVCSLLLGLGEKLIEHLKSAPEIHPKIQDLLWQTVYHATGTLCSPLLQSDVDVESLIKRVTMIIKWIISHRERLIQMYGAKSNPVMNIGNIILMYCQFLTSVTSTPRCDPYLTVARTGILKRLRTGLHEFSLRPINELPVNPLAFNEFVELLSYNAAFFPRTLHRVMNIRSLSTNAVHRELWGKFDSSLEHAISGHERVMMSSPTFLSVPRGTLPVLQCSLDGTLPPVQHKLLSDFPEVFDEEKWKNTYFPYFKQLVDKGQTPGYLVVFTIPLSKTRLNLFSPLMTLLAADLPKSTTLMNQRELSQLQTLDEPFRSIAQGAATTTYPGLLAFRNHVAAHDVGWPDALKLATAALPALSFKPLVGGSKREAVVLALSSLSSIAQSVQDPHKPRMADFFRKHQDIIIPWLVSLTDPSYLATLRPEVLPLSPPHGKQSSLDKVTYGILDLLPHVKDDFDPVKDEVIIDWVFKLWRNLVDAPIDDADVTSLDLLRVANDLSSNILRRTLKTGKWDLLQRLGGPFLVTTLLLSLVEKLLYHMKTKPRCNPAIYTLLKQSTFNSTDILSHGVFFDNFDNKIIIHQLTRPLKWLVMNHARLESKAAGKKNTASVENTIMKYCLLLTYASPSSDFDPVLYVCHLGIFKIFRTSLGGLSFPPEYPTPTALGRYINSINVHSIFFPSMMRHAARLYGLPTNAIHQATWQKFDKELGHLHREIEQAEEVAKTKLGRCYAVRYLTWLLSTR